jgi:Zn-dependent protease
MRSASINKYLRRVENNLLRIEDFHKRGCPVDSSMGELYLDLKNLGAYLKQVQSEDISTTSQELAESNERYKELLLKYESLVDKIQSREERGVVASSKTLPLWFESLSKVYPGFWGSFERLATAFGLGMIGFTIIGPSYFLAAGQIPFAQYYQLEMNTLNALVFVLGIFIGLLLHEFAHAVVLAHNGIGIKRVGAMAGSMLGGFVEAEESSFLQAHPRVHFRFNAAGIGTNLLLAVVLMLIGGLMSSQVLIFLGLGSLFFGFINSYPIKPLDGGWVYGDLVNSYLKDDKVRNSLLTLPLLMFVVWILLFVRSALM